MSPILIQVLAAVAGGLVAGWILGRFTGAAAARSRELADRVESLRKESERVSAELAAAKAQIAQLRSEQEQYRARVSDHFAGASERFRDLSLQYRSLFDHLSEGARCAGTALRRSRAISSPERSPRRLRRLRRPRAATRPRRRTPQRAPERPSGPGLAGPCGVGYACDPRQALIGRQSWFQVESRLHCSC